MSIWEQFVLAGDSPQCLLGRGLLQALDIELHLSPEEMDLIIMGMSVITRSLQNEPKNLEC